jgi:hypothetical protein
VTPALLFAIRLAFVGAVPISMGLSVHNAAERHDVPPAHLGALLISEHNGAYPSDSISAVGMRGLFQLSPYVWIPWACEHHEFCITGEDLDNPHINTELAAMVLAYTQARVANCGHHWAAHWKCGRKGRDECKPVRRVKRLVKEIGG